MPGLVPGTQVVLACDEDVDGRDKPGHDGEVCCRRAEETSVLLLVVVVLVEKTLRPPRQMPPVLERRIAIGGEQSGVVGNRLAQRLDPGTIALGEIGQHMPMDNVL